MPVIGVVVAGGLGNQMFQLAAGYAYAKKYGCELQLTRTKIDNDGRTTYWDSALMAWRPFLVDRFPDGIVHWYQPGNGSQTYVELPVPKDIGFRLHGYYQSSKYFGSDKTKSEIKKLMAPSADSMNYIKTKYASLLERGKNVVVVHARRGDYCRNESSRKYFGPLTADYYIRTITDMAAIVKEPHFLLVCEEPDFWADIRATLPFILTESNCTVLEESDEIKTLALLQQFKNFIIANSTFSWWAAWMADATHVFAPQNWFGPTGVKGWHDIYESGWVLY